MNIDILRTFLSVAKTGSFTKAADENFCTQSTASLRIKSLEDHYGLRLFDRIGKAVYLNNDGMLLQPHIELVVDTFDQTGELVLQLKKLSHGKISVISSHTPGNYIIPQILLDFHKNYPNIMVCSQIAYAKNVINHIDRSNQYDLGIISQPETGIDKYKPMTIEVKEFIDDPLLVIVGKDHPWADKQEVRATELQERTIFLSNQETSLMSYLHSLTGIELKEEKKIIIGSQEAVKKAVQFSDGFSILSGFIVKEEINNGTLKSVRLKGHHLKRKIYFVSKKNKIFSPAMQTFMNNVMKWGEEPKW